MSEADTEEPTQNFEIGDIMWVWPATGATDFEQRLSTRVEEYLPNCETVFLSAYSISPSVCNESDLVHTITISEHDSVVFLIEAHDEDCIRKTDVLHTITRSGGNNHISVSSSEQNIGDQYILVVAHPFHGDLRFELASHKSHELTGLLACLLGEALVRPAVFSGVFSVKNAVIFDGRVGKEKASEFHNFSQQFGDLSSSDTLVSGLVESEKKALRMVSMAFRSRDRVARWVYYRAALEQAYGRNYTNAVKKKYKSEPKVRLVAEQTIARLKALRDDVVHNAVIGNHSAFDERAIQCVILDGILQFEDSSRTFFSGMVNATAKPE